MKNKIVVVLVAALALSFVACAGTSEGAKDGAAAAKADSPAAQEKDAQYQQGLDDKQAMLESMFRGFLDAVRNGAPADTLYAYLTDSSEYWLDTLENHAKVYDSEALDTCQFYEAYTIILYRLYEREHLWETDEDRMLFMMLSKSGMLERFTNLNLGPMKVKNDRGSVGLAKSPEVPVIIFEWDDLAWKLDLPETLPLITKGIESIAVKKNWTAKKLALYWIEKEYHMTYSRLDDSLLEPIGF
ncbi:MULTISPECIES: hypothetical protein [unclassified Fibrobacter]|uniref:hypothetical protein n=1 Tax=unclassified Fibrobacter TaxID=2634177 RepID=UPI0025BDDBFE|nr:MULTISPECIES: hypothetical protein [unclassified Fibrobacter]